MSAQLLCGIANLVWNMTAALKNSILNARCFIRQSTNFGCNWMVGRVFEFLWSECYLITQQSDFWAIHINPRVTMVQSPGTAMGQFWGSYALWLPCVPSFRPIKSSTVMPFFLISNYARPFVSFLVSSSWCPFYNQRKASGQQLRSLWQYRHSSY